MVSAKVGFLADNGMGAMPCPREKKLARTMPNGIEITNL